MTLKKHLLERIAQDGPMSVADYTTECMLHPTHGYYTTRDPLGVKGDFVTAPEISQMFGELIGLALAQSWQDQGHPEHFVLAELGPGRGTLMADILRATARVPGFHDAAEVVLFEASPTLRAIQAKTLKGHEPRWIGSVADLPEAPLYLVANEFFDALPVRQFVRDGNGWRERLIGSEDGALTWGLGPQAEQVALKDRLNDTKDGDLVELCAAAIPIITVIAGRIGTHGGGGVIVDYGDWHSQGDTFQAVQAHEHCDPLAMPGKADLTAHVDFEPLALATRAAGCAHSRLTSQGVFLERLGITARAQALATQLDGPKHDELVAAHRRLTHPEEMGNLFKVLGLYPSPSSPPPGLEP
ncbi:class I SAM-dependent methyltransferase [Ruegeria atlantica]|uniref:class I SAM-dependent methyltransferase n=1 Tax=Ruegeria atlantica TaxID=81569 RepID=UPI001479F2C8|nr:SAM-dependent methyltransferase [Ruegeria atlantica]